jgi:hypothetical protein
MIARIAYPILALQVELLYQKEFPIGNNKAIEEHCEYIAKFIESCGWTMDQYLERFMQDEESN